MVPAKKHEFRGWHGFTTKYFDKETIVDTDSAMMLVDVFRKSGMFAVIASAGEGFATDVVVNVEDYGVVLAYLPPALPKEPVSVLRTKTELRRGKTLSRFLYNPACEATSVGIWEKITAVVPNTGSWNIYHTYTWEDTYTETEPEYYRECWMALENLVDMETGEIIVRRGDIVNPETRFHNFMNIEEYLDVIYCDQDVDWRTQVVYGKFTDGV